MPISIRIATPSDLPELREVAIVTQVDTFGAYNTQENMDAFIRDVYSLDAFQREMTEPDSALYLACDQNRITGFLRLRKTSEVEHLLGKNSIELQRLYVLKEYRGQKVGSLLMEKAMEYAKTKKFDWMWLGVWERNFKAQDFYRKWKFERFSEHVFWMGSDPQTDWLLKRRLENDK